LTPLELSAFACTPEGFTVLLGPRGTPLPRAANLVEHLRGAAPADEPPPDGRLLPLLVTSASDSSAPDSPQALTLLLLAQSPPCDLASAALLPPDALHRALSAGGASCADDARLSAVVVTSSPIGGAVFSCQLFSSEDGSAPALLEDAWLALALFLRYQPYGARLFATGEALAACPPLARARPLYPSLVTAAEVREQGRGASDGLLRAFAKARDSKPEC